MLWTYQRRKELGFLSRLHIKFRQSRPWLKCQQAASYARAASLGLLKVPSHTRSPPIMSSAAQVSYRRQQTPRNPSTRLAGHGGEDAWRRRWILSGTAEGQWAGAWQGQGLKTFSAAVGCTRMDGDTTRVATHSILLLVRGE
jgi:hypothetical protein